MSGGSFNYLCDAYDAEDLLRKRSDLQDMSEFLAARGYAKDAAMETVALLARLRQFEVWAEVTITRLSPVWKAAEWWQSCDFSEDQFKDALETYRDCDPTPADTVGGGAAHQESTEHPNCGSKDCCGQCGGEPA